jgi:hypothetical protein
MERIDTVQHAAQYMKAKSDHQADLPKEADRLGNRGELAAFQCDHGQEPSLRKLAWDMKVKRCRK